MTRFKIVNYGLALVASILLIIGGETLSYIAYCIIAVLLLWLLWLNYPLWGHESVRRWFYLLVFDRDVRNAVASMNPLIAYPLTIWMDLELNLEKEYIARGHDNFVKWFTEESGKKIDEIANNLSNAFKGSKERGWTYSPDKETEELMKQARSEEYEGIADRANMEEFMRKWRIHARDRFIHKSSNKKRLKDERGKPFKYEWQKALTPEEILERREFTKNQLRWFGNEEGKRVLRQMEKEDEESETLLEEIRYGLYKDSDFDEQL